MSINKLNVRQSIADCASSLRGSHYLWGAGGATPGNSDGAAYRRGGVALHPARTDPKDPKIFAAQCGGFVCAGRYNKIPGGRVANPNDADLIRYLAQLKDQDPASWQPYFQRFSPRMVEGSNVPHQIVWGEDCRNRSHFDCISFINYVFSMTSKQPWSASIELYIANTDNVSLSSPPVPGDIVTRGTTHIGFLNSDGYVVQAEMSSNGVHADERYSAGSWSYRGRLADRLLPDVPRYT